jgi:hypothetical protein
MLGEERRGEERRGEERSVLFRLLLSFVLLLLASLLFIVIKETLSAALCEYKANFWFTIGLTVFLILMHNFVVIRLIG